ncbi:MAG: glycosyltransferase family 4 protein [Gammaproteobacteria bacterium]|nr:glycosyltransferase family 4 protein [Gammaproteobacteria bacterium]
MSERQLAVFLTRGMSLASWEAGGMLERELALYRRLVQRGWRVKLVSYGDASERRFADRLAGVELLVNRWRLPVAWYSRWLAGLHRTPLRGTCVIKTNQTNGALAALRVARQLKVPLIARQGYLWSDFAQRQFGADSRQARQARDAEQRTFSGAARVVLTSQRDASAVCKRQPAVCERTTVIPNYVDTQKFRPAPAAAEPGRVVFVGRLAEQKNLELLLEATAGSRVRHLQIIGSGPLEAGLRERFGDLDGRIEWSGTLGNDALPGALVRACAFALASRYEGHPKALLEGMACGLPAVATRVPGIQEVVVDGETGWLSEQNPAALRVALDAVCANPEEARRRGALASRKVQEHFSLDAVVEQELQLLDQVVTNQ